MEKPMCCDLEIDINGQETFFADKKILAFFSGRLRKLFSFCTLRGATATATGRMKVIFHEFPGGVEAFELISRYCYNRGNIKITFSDSLPLHLAAIFMEMNEDNRINNGRLCLMSQTTEIYLKGISLCPWSELVDCLKCFQEFLPLINKSNPSMFNDQEFLDGLVGRLSLSWRPNYLSSYTPDTCSSSPSSCIQFSSGDIISIGRSSSYSSLSARKWWFGDFDFLNLDLFQKLMETMITAQNLDNFVISSFLFHYQKFKFSSIPTPTADQKCKIIETLINLLYLLMNNTSNRSFISLRGLFHILQLSLTLEIEKSHIERLEILIASLLDQATIDDLLFPSPRGETYAYDVNLILRLQNQFLLQVGSNHFNKHRVKKVAVLIDYYITEVAPDPELKPSKFVALATSLPDFARDSHDMFYEAMDVYFKVHNNLCEEEKIKLRSALNYDKLSAKSLIHLAHNSNFPAHNAMGNVAAVSQYSNLEILPKKDLSGHRSVLHKDKGGELKLDQVIIDMNKSTNASRSRIRMLKSRKKVSSKKQTKLANMMKLSSIC